MKRQIYLVGSVVLFLASCMSVPPAPTATAQPSATPASIPTPLELGVGSSMVSEKDGTTLVYVPAGEFSMGNDGGWKEEKPLHTVTLDAFWIDRTEITNEMYARCVQAGNCPKPSNAAHFEDASYADHPVVYVSWKDASQYCTWADRRLPTEAEWEKAARGTDRRVFPWGDTIDCSLANYWGGENGCVEDTSPVGKYSEGASPYGALDMTGNVLEWVNTAFTEYPYDPADGREAAETSGPRVLRGGSWNVTAEFTRTSRRDWYQPVVRRNYVGFRCAMNATP